ncbi:hypothetical protein Sjap_026131 [Stephania japonica]|uniref:Uncharacterized protein n=1 Tax=Stephania japonica TaxID=461633 RepID=A0AAP0E2Y0_9MAGN
MAKATLDGSLDLLETDRKKIPTTEDLILEFLPDMRWFVQSLQNRTPTPPHPQVAALSITIMKTSSLMRMPLKMEENDNRIEGDLKDESFEVKKQLLKVRYEVKSEFSKYEDSNEANEEETLNDVSLMSIEVDEDAIEEYYAMLGKVP